MATDPHFETAALFFQDLQDRIVAALERLDGGRFRHDDWTRDEGEPAGPVLGGFGRTRVLEGGAVLEKAGVNFSQVHGKFSEAFAATMPGAGLDFMATGISLVLHPRNPYVPTVHMNYRRLARGDASGDGGWHGWFGGGADLTPYYFDPQDAQHFHDVHRRVCDRFSDIADWSELVAACDRYFQLPHRGERRGIGGIFFDHRGEQPDRTFAFARAAGDAFLDAWLPIAVRHRDDAYGERERAWQLVRRGRYVEFNLIQDRGTLFGLKTGGRIESILMSLPPLASWQYGLTPTPGSPEAELLAVLRAGYRPEGA
jgi:coproporphyrinogen III oxidase